MSHWPDRRILDLLGIELPILQAPMAGATGSAMAIAVGLAGGLGALPCAMLSGEQVRAEIAAFRAGCPGRPLNLNFFCHQPPAPDAERDARWKQAQALLQRSGRRLRGAHAGVQPCAFRRAELPAGRSVAPGGGELPLRPAAGGLLQRVKASGAKVLSSATTVEEAAWLERNGCDAIIAMGYEAGGHRGMF